jgi:SAM-dependent methyltransferase
VSENLIHQVVGYGSRIPALRSVLWTMFRLKARHHPAMRHHPLDIYYGTRTSGMLPPWLIRSGKAADNHSTFYIGCQPSCLRAALTAIPELHERSFVDIGCGKGRALIVASEFPFRRVLGVELVPGLEAVARRNAGVVRRRHPQRAAIETVLGDATNIPLPDGDLVIFFYHSFGRELFSRMLDRIADEVVGTSREMFLIYENPVNGDMVDNKSGFSRWYCKTVACEADELGFGPDESDTVVVWRLSQELPKVAPQEAATPIVVTDSGWKAILATDVPGS